MKWVYAVVLAALTVVCGSPALAEPLEGQDQESRVLSDNWYGAFGWFGADLTTDLGFGFGRFAGSSIRLEDDLSVEDTKDSFRFAFRYRFNRRHSISLSGFQLNRNGSRVIDREIEIENPDGGDGLRFLADGSVASELDNQVVGLYYNYSFFNNGKLDAGVSAGLATHRFDLGLEGQAEIIDENGDPIAAAEFREASSSVTAPIPAWGIYMNYAIRHNVIFSVSAASLNLDVGDYEGRVADTRGTVEWFFSRYVGVGAGLTNTSIEFRDNGDDPYRIEYRYGGFLLYFAGAF